MASNVLPDSFVGREAGWLIEVLRSGAEGLTEERLCEHVQIEGAEPRHVLVAVQRMAQALGSARLASVVQAGEHRLALVLVPESGTGTKVTIETDGERIRRMWLGRAAPENVRVRRAERADEEKLRRLHAETPRPGKAPFTVEIGDFWNVASLMLDPAVFIAEHDGAEAGMIAVAIYEGQVGGLPLPLLYIHRARVLPDFQRMGIGSALVDAALGYASDLQVGAMYWYLGLDNEVSQAFAGGVTPDWSVAPKQLVLRCADLAREGRFEATRPADAGRVAEVLNASHAGEELYRPYSAESLAARLSRSPSLYSWPQLHASERAVIGVRADAAEMHVRSQRGGAEETTARGLVLDYGCMPGAEAEFESLLRAVCARLVREGVDELALMTSERAHLYGLLTPLAADTSEYRLRSAGVREPAGGLPRGLYTDLVYV